MTLLPWTLTLLPIVPLVAALLLALGKQLDQPVAIHVVTVMAVLVILVALLMPAIRLDLPGVLVLGNPALVIDPVARAALLLFGSLWLAAALMFKQQGDGTVPAMALLVTLSGAVTLAMAEGQALVYAVMLVCGYGVFALLAWPNDGALNRAGRALIVMLVISDVLVFEVLLGAAKEPGMELKPFYLVLLVIALMLRGGMAPAHVWLPVAFKSLRSGALVLVATVPAATALYAAVRMLPGAVTDLAPMFLVLGLVGTVWVSIAGLAQAHYRAILGYAVAATAAVLLLALPMTVDSGAYLAAVGLTLLTSAAAALLVVGLAPGHTRRLLSGLVLVLHALAIGQVAWHAPAVLPGLAVWLVPLVGLMATALFSYGVFSGLQYRRGDPRTEVVWSSWVLVLAATIGLGMGLLHKDWMAPALVNAPAGIGLGFVLYRLLAGDRSALLPPGDLLAPIERIVNWLLRLGRVVCMRRLPILRDRCEAILAGMWRGEFWSRQVESIDTRLRIWTATSILMLVVAVTAAFLLVQ
jgi:hypothetical protein